MSTPPDLDALRHRIRAWCAASVPADWRTTTADLLPEQHLAFQRRWLATLDDGGWAVPHWPADHGGGLSLLEQAVVYEELARADAPRLSQHFVALNHAASTLIHAGTADQRVRHLPAIRDGEIWCQGFSEPNAGSDLAALQTIARTEGDHFVINGQKTWSSAATHADWCLLLVRSDPQAPKRDGISFLLMDMHSDGVEVRPIRNARGDAHFCELFLTDVRVPKENLVGPENGGWHVAMSTLNAERGATMVELVERLDTGVARLARELFDTTPKADPDSYAMVELVRLISEVRALREVVRRSLGSDVEPREAATLASMTKLVYSELLQRVTEFATNTAAQHVQLETPLNPSGGWESGAWLLDFIGSWEWTIPGGTSEIQRTIIAERGLGLPREGATR